MKLITLVFLFFISTFLYSQELNVGGFTGTGKGIVAINSLTLGGTLEYRPEKAFFAINTSPFILVSNNEANVTIPLSLKLIIGNKIRLCPTAGGFIRTNSNYGLLAGLEVDYRLKEKLFPFVKGEYAVEYYKATAPSHFGPSYEYLSYEKSKWISIGFKVNLFK